MLSGANLYTCSYYVEKLRLINKERTIIMKVMSWWQGNIQLHIMLMMMILSLYRHFLRSGRSTVRSSLRIYCHREWRNFLWKFWGQISQIPYVVTATTHNFSTEISDMLWPLKDHFKGRMSLFMLAMNLETAVRYFDTMNLTTAWRQILRHKSWACGNGWQHFVWPHTAAAYDSICRYCTVIAAFWVWFIRRP